MGAGLSWQIKLKMSVPDLNKIYTHNELWKEISKHVKGLSEEIIGKLLVQWLTCKALHDEPQSISVPAIVDEIWHLAILNTVMYNDMCIDMFGKFIHHTTVTSHDSPEKKIKRVVECMRFYKKVWHECSNDEIENFANRQFERFDLKIKLEDGVYHQDEKLFC